MALQTPEMKGWQGSAKGVNKGVNCRVGKESAAMPDFGERVEGLTTVGYPRLVKWLSKGRRSEPFKLGKMPEDLDIHPRLIANFSSMPRKLRSEKREKIDEDLEICFVVKGRRESGVVGFTDAVKQRVGKRSAKAQGRR